MTSNHDTKPPQPDIVAASEPSDHRRDAQRRPALRLGGLWVQKGRDGTQWLEGNFGPTLRITIRANRNKGRGTNDPDFVMLLNQRSNRK